MKRFYTLLLCTAFVAPAFGQLDKAASQQSMAPNTASAQEIDQARAQGVDFLNVERGGDEFFCEDFANGFDGNNPFGEWTIEDTGGNTIWMMANNASPAGEFSTGIGALASPSANNGWAIFDCDLWNTPISNGFETVTGYLTSPVMDMTELNSVIVDFYHYFRYCCQSPNPLDIQVTNDGGANWSTFPAYDGFFQSANDLSANPINAKVDISCAAAGMAEVQIRFAYNEDVSGDAGNYSHYFWGIDDVCIYENPAVSDILVTQVTNGDVIANYEYRVIPMEQAISAADSGLVIQTYFRNVGSEDQTNVVVTSEVLDADMNVLASVAGEPFDLPSNLNAESCPQGDFYEDIHTFWEPETEGMYYVRTTITSDQIDDTPDDNTMMKEFFFTPETWGHDWEDDYDVELRPREANSTDPNVPVYEPTGYANIFEVVNDGSTAYGLTASFGGQSDGGCEFGAVLYRWEDGLSTFDPNASEVVAFAYVIYNNNWDDQTIFIPFDDPVEMFEGEIYFAAILEEFGSDFEITVMANDETDTDFSTLQYLENSANAFVWFFAQPETPGVRLITADWVDVPEIDLEAGIELGQNVPNPAPYNTVIYYSLEQTMDIAFEIRDLNGRLVHSEDLGTLPAGSHQLNVVTSNFARGMYNYTLIANDDVRLTKKMMVLGGK